MMRSEAFQDFDMIRGSSILSYVRKMFGHKQSALPCSRHPSFFLLYFSCKRFLIKKLRLTKIAATQASTTLHRTMYSTRTKVFAKTRKFASRIKFPFQTTYFLQLPHDDPQSIRSNFFKSRSQTGIYPLSKRTNS